MERAAILGAVRTQPGRLRRMGSVDGYIREAQEVRRAADEAEIAELTTLPDEVRSFPRRVPVQTRRQLPYQFRKAKQELA